MIGGIVGALVDTEDDRRVVTGGRSRDDDLLGSRVDVLLRVGGLREETGRLDDDLDAELAPGQVRGVALFEDADRLAVDDDVVAVELDGGVEAAGDRVEFEQVGESRVVGQIVDRDDLKVTSFARAARK
ncbi:hypothetical protein GCM10025867_28570 [Frondihabitans sucicola]|uniref:TRAM domain-containing protein n=1 Tax=Frondihabitans sucicola TaxID=1268041 RepID=A0ABN6Y0Q5_9MICO|nr:hypothetical protein GCM10025867_28570 [Frondihabitans sucicola]